MLWACILLPQLAMDGVLRHCADSQAPLVLLAGPPQRRILKRSIPQPEHSARPGQALTAAQALTTEFTTADYDQAAIDRWQRFLAAWAYGFSAQVSLRYPRCLLLEVHSSLGLFGPWPVFEARLREELTTLGFQHRITAAPNPAAARVLANARDGLAVFDDKELLQALHPLPVARLGLPEAAATAFSRMGIRQLQQLLALPRDSLAKRFSAEVLLHLDTVLAAARSPWSSTLRLMFSTRVLS